MERRNFFKNAGLFGLGSALLNPLDLFSQELEVEKKKLKRKAKNIIFLVSDGMSFGTLNMADLYLNRKTGKGSHWLNLYRNQRVSRGLMDMASASSMITDSAAASSSWGGGFRIKNGGLNVGANGIQYKPILQKFKDAGKKVGCVTTVPVTHATPAGFCVSTKSRNSQADIAEMYLDLGFDVMMGGGHEFFSSDKRKDGKDLYGAFQQKNYQVVKSREDMFKSNPNKSLLGVFYEDGLPYSLDRNNTDEFSIQIPTLAEMAFTAIENMKLHPEGFVLQIEGGKVDWAAHANCVGGLIYDQIAFDEAISVAIDFAEKDGETLVVITSDHGNSNPGLLYGKDADDNFDKLQKFKHTNEWILNGINANFSISQVLERIQYANGFSVSHDEAKNIFSYYHNIEKSEEGLYNYKKLPFKLLSEIQKNYTNVGWIGDNHSADYVELAMFGPGSELQGAFTKNTDLHWFMLHVTGVKDSSY